MAGTGLDDAQRTWIKGRLSIPTGGSGGKAETPAAIPPARLATLRKTFDNLKSQSPDIAVRPLQDIATELELAAIAATDLGAVPSPDARDLEIKVTEALETLKSKANDIARGHAAAWLRQIDNVPSGAGGTPAIKTARAKAINDLLCVVEPGIAADTHMLKQVGGDPTILNQVATLSSKLKDEYKTLLPARTTEGDPARLPPVAKPDIALTGKDATDLAALMQSTQALMGADKATKPADVEAAVALIRQGIDTESAKAILLRLGNWVAVKTEYRTLAQTNAPAGKAFMAKMWWYRRMVVDEAMTKLQKDYDFTWGSVGSDNPESDYDLTVRTHGTNKTTGEVVRDFQIVELANAAISKDFGGTPPGILFDTNLYAEAAVNTPEPTEEQKANPTFKAMGAMKEQGQDVGALMKMRRYMEWDEWQDYQEKMLAGMTDPAARKVAEQQFSEADSLYFIARSEQLMKAAMLNPDPDAQKLALTTIESIPNTPDGQKRLLELAAELEHDDAKSMATNNALYLEKMEEVRKLEAQYDKEPSSEKKAALLAKLKSLQADATFFAAEAYHSEGPLLHVVKAGQSSRLEVEGNRIAYPTPEGVTQAQAIEALKQAKLDKMSANQMLQSFNENLGDLLKDLRHYASEPFPGLGFYRSSKYIERLCDAVGLLAAKMPGKTAATVTGIQIAGKPPAGVKTAMAKLVDIRGEKTGFPEAADAEKEKQAFAIAQMAMVFPGVTTLPDLAKLMSGFGREINAAVRSAIATEMTAADPAAYFAT